MTLPDSKRDIYARNPIAEVAAQLNFPPILRIETEPPAHFQDSIRDRYPQYRRVQSGSQLPPNLPAPVRNLIQGLGAAAGPIQHVFESLDGKLVITLSRQSLAFKTTAYTHWEAFRDQLASLSTTFERLYQPAAYSRVGLRYVNIIRRSILGLESVPWSELLNPSIGGELTAPEFGDDIDKASSELHCKLGGENSFLTLRTGLAVTEREKERCFLIDGDFHTHKHTESANVTTTLDLFNRSAGNLFRWSIRERLRDALQPQ